MEKWNAFKITKMDKEVLDIYLKHGFGFVKMYDASYFTNLSDETACLTLKEFADKCVVLDGGY